MVQAAVFDAVNGIERRYTHIRVEPAAPRGASQRAAAVQAAYGVLVKLYPGQKTALDAHLASSLAAVANDAAVENSQSIARGIEWGQTVASAVWAFDDHFNNPPPTIVDGTNPGEWRRTAPGQIPAGAQFPYMIPWSIVSPSQFRPGGPPALGSARYAADFAETKLWGSNVIGPPRTDDQTLYSRFWNASTASYYWDTIAVSLSDERHLTLSENARLLALLNIAMADAIIACWEAKYHYFFWRPVTAIRLDGIPADATWTPLLVTPAHPEYPSGHSSASGAAGAVLADYFGEQTSFTIGSDVFVPPTTRSFTSFSAALDEIKNARIYAGIHFRSACDDAQATGISVANWVLGHSLLPVNGNHNGQIQH
jgi:hypothetical protein